jgi:hypothetical protein
MKKIGLYILAILSVVSCSEDFLETQPLDKVTVESFYKTYQDADNALTATYAVLRREGWGNNVCLSSVASDECFGAGGNSDGPTSLYWDQFTNSNDLYSETWKKCFSGIARANLLLDNFDRINWGENIGKKEIYRSEARFLRANFYFELVRFYGNVPLIKNAITDLGKEQVTQANPDSVYKFIAQDLKAAIDSLPANPYPAGNNGRVTRWAAEGLMARVFLYYTGYYGEPDLAGVVSKNEVRGYIDDIINNGNFGLLPSYSQLWEINRNYAGKGNKESIFSIKFTGAANKDLDWNSKFGNNLSLFIGLRDVKTKYTPERWGYGNGWGYCSVNPKVWNSFDPADMRRNNSIINFKAENFSPADTLTIANSQRQYTGMAIKKYMIIGKFDASADSAASIPGGDMQLNNFTDIYVMRFADVLLMGAELNLDNNLALAQKYFDMVRDRAFGDNTHRVALSNDAAGKNLIMNERLYELSFEGLRYWDLLRQGVDVAKAAIDNSSSSPLMNISFPAQTKGLFAIPQSEIKRSNGKLVQNTGWID